MDKNKLYKVNTIAKKTFIYAFLIMLAIISIMPFYLLIVNSTMSHQEISTSYSFVFKDSFLSNFQKMVADTNNKIFTAARNSLIISLGTAALATYFSAATAYGIHMYNFKGKKAAFIFILTVFKINTDMA
ncbi:MAG: hypothetical protein RBQ97_06350 [Acholeplasma sp.]|nr:hypothetical protein [Acholeplasma sp.]